MYLKLIIFFFFCGKLINLFFLQYFQICFLFIFFVTLSSSYGLRLLFSLLGFYFYSKETTKSSLCSQFMLSISQWSNGMMISMNFPLFCCCYYLLFVLDRKEKKRNSCIACVGVFMVSLIHILKTKKYDRDGGVTHFYLNWNTTILAAWIHAHHA